MIEVTEMAQKQIADYFKDKKVMPVRIFLNDGGWAGPSLSMALDELKDTDYVHEAGGIQYISDKEFIEKIKPVKVDFTEMGFKVTSSMKSEGGCSGCGSTCSS